MPASLTPNPGLIYKLIQVHLCFPTPRSLIELLVQATKENWERFVDQTELTIDCINHIWVISCGSQFSNLPLLRGYMRLFFKKNKIKNTMLFFSWSNSSCSVFHLLFIEDVKHDGCSEDEHLVMPTHQQFVQRYFTCNFHQKSFEPCYLPAFHKTIVIYAR